MNDLEIREGLATGELVAVDAKQLEALRKRVADIHGAAIDVQSRAGEGSRFTVRFPAV